MFLGRDALEDDQVAGIEPEQHRGVEHAESALGDDPAEVEERRDQAHDLGGVLPVEADRGEEVGLAARAARQRVDRPDGRPAQPGQEAQGAGEVGGHERDVAVPGDDGLDRELGQHLDPGEQGEGEALRDVELRRLGAPRHDERARQDRREGPERLERRAPRLGGVHPAAEHRNHR